MPAKFYRAEADRAFPEGCKCGNNGGGDCDWCSIYYDWDGAMKEPKLSTAMAACLLRKHTVGDVGVHNWGTVVALLNRGYFELSADRRYIKVTAKGKAYCDGHHLEM